MKRLSLLAVSCLGLSLSACSAITGSDSKVVSPATVHPELVGNWTSVSLAEGSSTLLLGGDDGLVFTTLAGGVPATGNRYSGTWDVAGDSLVLRETRLEATADGSTWTGTAFAQVRKFAYVLKGDTLKATVSGAVLAYVRAAGFSDGSATTVATPTFSVAGGAYALAQTVSIATATPGAAIHYTLDGTVPTVASPRYTGDIAVSRSLLLRAVALKDGLANSAETSASYAISDAKFAAMVGNWTSVGLYNVDLNLILGGEGTFSIDNEMTGMVVQGTRYSGTWRVSGDTLVLLETAMALSQNASDWSYSDREVTEKIPYALKNDTLRGTYLGSSVTFVRKVGAAVIPRFDTASAPTFSVAGGSYTTTQQVSLASATAGATIRYTLDGSVPTVSSRLYKGALKLRESVTLKAIAIQQGMATSKVASASYVVTLPPSFLDSLSGTWRLTDAEGLETMALDANGSATLVAVPKTYGETTPGVRATATWRVTGRSLALSITSYKCSYDGLTWTEMPVTNGDQSATVTVTATNLRLVYSDTLVEEYVRGTVAGRASTGAGRAPVPGFGFRHLLLNR